MECLQLGKAVYGLVNAPRVWWAKVNQVMARLGWIASSLEPGLWSLMSKHGRILALCCVHVDGFFWPHMTRARVKLDRTVTHWNNSSGGQHGKTVTSSICGVHYRQNLVHNWQSTIRLDQHDYAHVIESLQCPSSARDDQPLTPWEI